MSWTVLIPLKAAGLRKTRLSSLSTDERDELALAMHAHVCTCVRDCGEISCVVSLSATKLGPDQWQLDEGRGLNAELMSYREATPNERLIVLLPDLPFLRTTDVLALTKAGRASPAVASNRHGSGTNALALPPGTTFPFQFGRGSLNAHAVSAGDAGQVLRRPGLMHDIDTHADLAEAANKRHALPPALAKLD